MAGVPVVVGTGFVVCITDGVDDDGVDGRTVMRVVVVAFVVVPVNGCVLFGVGGGGPVTVNTN